MRKKPSVDKRRITPAGKRLARERREERRKRIYLLSLQELPVEKLEKMFKKIVDGDVKLVGVNEYPERKIKLPAFLSIRKAF